MISFKDSKYAGGLSIEIIINTLIGKKNDIVCATLDNEKKLAAEKKNFTLL